MQRSPRFSSRALALYAAIAPLALGLRLAPLVLGAQISFSPLCLKSLTPISNSLPPP